MSTVVKAIIERASDGTYTVFCEDEFFSGAGQTLSAAKEDMLSQMSFYRKTAREEGFKYPTFLDGEFTISYRVDARSIMKYYIDEGIFSLAGLQKVTGINQKQLWAYLHGTKPRKAQEERIVSGFHALSNDLMAIFA